ncbi:hypothetical protein Sjap_000314 [Stephania japonica]|uniref:Uncharacterized protein n=1 Tax=Stephania japonica TaxID=461633 RepID=A0AAP0KJZ9_9MAGN
MAAVSSSSRRKSSSLMKKKRSKNSSEVRKRRSRSRTRKSLKSKKVRRRDVSVSSSDDDDSRMNGDSVSATSSDSVCENRRGRARSRTQRKLRGSRKRARSEGSSSESPHRRKKKGLKRSQDSKKKQKKKRTSGRMRRDVSVDSFSNDSWSCSTCWEEVVAVGRVNLRGLEADLNGCDNRGDYQSEEELPTFNDSRRLRSVITVESRHDETEERFVSKEKEKADIIQGYDDCPSGRSSDSNDCNKRHRKEYSQQIIGALEKKGCADDNKVDQCRLKGEESTGPLEGENLELILRQKALENLRKFRVGIVNKKTTGDNKLKNDNNVEKSSAANVEVEQSEEANEKVAGAEEMIVKHEENVSMLVVDKKATTCSPNCNQTPNENGGLTSKSKVKQDEGHPEVDACDRSSNRINAVKAIMSNKNSVSFKNKSSESTSVSKKESCVDHSNLKKMHPSYNPPDLQSSEAKNVTHIKVPVTLRGNAVKTEANKVRKAIASDAPPLTPVKAIISNKNSTGFENKSSQGTSVSKQENASEAKNVTKITFPVTIRENAVRTEANGVHNAVASDLPILAPVTGQDGSKKPGDSAGVSQFEEKTMSVMRGGELVQVSCKVYIPKKPPALARRQLKRPSDLQ